MIEKIIHLSWLGDALPDYALVNIKAWRALNPEYQVICWFSSEPIGDTLTTELSEDKIKCVNVVSQSHFKNYALIREFLEGGNPLAAADVLKVELMVYFGGYYFDLGITPQKPLDEVVPRGAKALCDIDSVPSVSINGTKLNIANRTNGSYHFHASCKGGELYTKAQDLQTALFRKIKAADPDFFQILLSRNKELGYQATKISTGSIVFLAVDCLMIKHAGQMSFLSFYSVTNLGLPKERLERRPGLDPMDALVLLGFVQRLKPLRDSFLSQEPPPKALLHGLFKAGRSPHVALVQEMKRMDSIPLDLKEAIEQKKYALALRRACAVGHCKTIELLDRYREFLSINYDERSSNGKSAWDWLEASSATAEEKERFRSILVAPVAQARP